MILSTDNKQKIDSIYGKLSRGEWFDAAFTAGVVIDFIVGEMLKEIIAALPPAERAWVWAQIGAHSMRKLAPVPAAWCGAGPSDIPGLRAAHDRC